MLNLKSLRQKGVNSGIISPMFKILTFPNPILRRRAKEVDWKNPRIQELSLGMLKFLKTANKGKPLGVGLSAPQIGESKKIIVVYSPASRRFLQMLNPEIIWRSKRTRLGIPGRRNPLEGCLSLPRLWGKVRRASIVKVFYQTPQGAPVIRKFRGFTGVIVQHEIDHLEGILFIDRIKEQGGKLYQLEKNKEGKETLFPVTQ